MGFLPSHLNNIETQNFIRDYANDILSRKAAIFAGAGLSIPCNLPSWKDLLEPMAAEIGLDVNKESDLLSVIQYYQNSSSGRGKIDQEIINRIRSVDCSPSEDHRILASLPIQTYWTTNYDNLIETAIADANKIADVKIVNANLTTHNPQRDVTLYKMHGDIANPESIVITRDDYEEYAQKMELFTLSLKSDLLSKTFLFLGFSFSDPNLLHIMAHLRLKTSGRQRTHYCIYRSVHRTDYNSDENFEYARNREKLWIADIGRYGIKIISIKDYEDITFILRKIQSLVARKSLFISGSAATYAPMSCIDAEKFIFQLANQLAAKGNQIITGFGLGVGSSVINGVLSHIYSKPGRRVDGKLLSLPFPQNIKNKEERQARWTQYRRDMISHAGIAIFIFGNKEVSGSIQGANGMEEEFAIAREMGLPLLPLSQTGHTAKKLWDTVNANLNDYYPSEEIRQAVCNLQAYPNCDQGLISRVITIISLLQK